MFDSLYARHAQRIAQHAYLLSGDANIARRAVAYGFRLAWERWPAIAVDPDPGGWVRAAAGEYALSPWHQFRFGQLWRRARQKPAPEAEFDTADAEHATDAEQARHPAAKALLTLHPGYRRCVVLHDVLRLSLPEIAAEAEATTAAMAARLAHAHQALADQLPQLRQTTPANWSDTLGRLLEEAVATLPDQTLPAPGARKRAERVTRLQILGTVALLALLTGAIALGFG